MYSPIRMAAQSNAWVCGRSLVGMMMMMMMMMIIIIIIIIIYLTANVLSPDGSGYNACT